MNQLLRFEFRKLFRRKSLYICGGIMIALSFLLTFTAFSILDLPPEFDEIFDLSGFGYMLTALDSSSFILIASIVTVLAVCDDFDQNTLKNVYAKGYSRTSVYVSKLLSAWLGVTVLFIVVELVNFLFGAAFFSVGTPSAKLWGLIGGQYLIMLANVTVFASIALMLRKVGGAIAICIVGPTLISVILALIDVFVGIEGFTLSNYWIDGFLSSMMLIDVESGRIVECLIGAAIYLVAFASIGWFVHKKRDA